MASSTASKHRTWSRDGFFISTDPSLIPLQSLNAALGSDMVYWAKAIPEDALQQMLDSSLSFGLYSPTSSLPPETEMPDATTSPEASEVLHEIAGHVNPHSQQTSSASARPKAQKQASFSPELIGFARCITDHVTFLYLTDVYILPAWQGQKLGKWLIQCVQEIIESMPYLRRSMAITGGADDPGKKTDGGMLEFYEREMGMKELTAGKVISWKGPGNVAF